MNILNLNYFIFFYLMDINKISVINLINGYDKIINQMPKKTEIVQKILVKLRNNTGKLIAKIIGKEILNDQDIFFYKKYYYIYFEESVADNFIEKIIYYNINNYLKIRDTDNIYLWQEKSKRKKFKTDTVFRNGSYKTARFWSYTLSDDSTPKILKNLVEYLIHYLNDRKEYPIHELKEPIIDTLKNDFNIPNILILPINVINFNTKVGDKYEHYKDLEGPETELETKKENYIEIITKIPTLTYEIYQEKKKEFLSTKINTFIYDIEKKSYV